MAKRNGRRSQRHPGVWDLGNGTYRVRVYWTDPKTGRQRERERLVEAKSMTQALAKKQEIEDELRQKGGEANDSSVPRRLGDVADVWLAEVVAEKLEADPTQLRLCPSTRVRYQGSVRDFVKPFFGEMFGELVTVADIKAWREHLIAHGFKPATINGHHRVVKLVLGSVGNRAAHEVEELNEKVGARINRKEPNLLAPDELDRFLEIAQRDWPQHYPLILLLFTTAMRIGTALALRLDDLDLASGEIVVTRRLSEGEVVPGVKRNRFGEDTPPLLPEVYAAIMELRATFNEKQLASGLLFPAEDGRHHARTVLRKPFKDILKKAGIKKRFTPHGCRRTGAKLYGRTAGTRMAMEIAGHKTLRMHEHYSPIDAEEKQAAARQVFGGLKVIAGGVSRGAQNGERKEETGDVTGDRGPAGEEATAK